MSEIKLKPCPFCGGKARIEQIQSATWDKFVVTCKSPKCCAYYIGYCDEGLYDSKTKAIIAWNTRKPMDQIVKQLERERAIAFLTIANTGDERLDVAYERVSACLDKAIKIVQKGGAE